MRIELQNFASPFPAAGKAAARQVIQPFAVREPGQEVISTAGK